MNDSNPFTPTRTLADPASVTVQKAGPRIAEMSHNLFRGLLAFFFLGFVPIFILPNFTAMFSEFGIELPLLTQWVIHLSNFARRFFWLFGPFAFAVIVGIEVGIYFISSRRWKTLVNIVYWLALLIAIGLIGTSLLIPYSSIVTGLAAAPGR